MKETGCKGKRPKRAAYRDGARALIGDIQPENGSASSSARFRGSCAKPLESSREVDECEDLVRRIGEVAGQRRCRAKWQGRAPGDRRGDRAPVDARRRRHHVHRGDPDAGKGQITLTGQLGDVMKEFGPVPAGACCAAAPARSASRRCVPPSRRAPARAGGRRSQDGPSAGITIGRRWLTLHAAPSRHTSPYCVTDVARALLPIGGLKEKLTAAARAGHFRACSRTQQKRP